MKQNLDGRCPTRVVLDWLGDKWICLVFRTLGEETMRFGELQRKVGGVSQKMLTQTLRGLERDGLVTRIVYATVPPKVEYSVTELGRGLLHILEVMREWAEGSIEDVLKSRYDYDTRNEQKADYEIRVN